MAFFGIEVKPGKSFTHQYDKTRGRLHISLANLGWGANAKKSVLQCNIGNKAPIILSHLHPEKNDSCQLHLEFEEEVTFSVVGPRSVHLAGYYIGGRPRQNLLHDDDTESFGEDIGETETERSSDSTGDEFDDDFIDDGEPEVFPPSPLLGLKDNFVNWKVKKWLQKKHLVTDSSSDDDCLKNGHSFWEDEELPPKRNKTDGLNLLEPRNFDNKYKERRYRTIQLSSQSNRDVAKCALCDTGNIKKKNRKRIKVDCINNGVDKLNGTVLQDDKNSKNQELLAGVGVSGLGITGYNFVVEKLSSGKAGAKVAVDGNKVSIFYCGKLENGEVIESNIGQKPYNFILGKGQVIKGWNVCISGMQIGEKRRLIIPPSMGFGSEDVGSVPKDSYLHYDIELVDVL